MQVIEQTIKQKIFTIRGKQVMIDSDLAELYGVETKRLNEQVKRNINRFPKDFMFQLNEKELDGLRSQIVISSETSEEGQILRSQIATSKNMALKPQIKQYNEDFLRSQIATLNKGGRKYPTYAFTEQGVAMLSSVLRSQKAIDVNIQIIRAFIEMRKYISKNLELFQRLDKVENKLLTYDKNFEQIFNALEDKTLPNKGIFFDGQVFDAYKFISELIKSAKESIILIDNYVDETVLTLFEKRNENVKVVIYSNLTKQLELDLKKFNSQYERIEIKQFNKSHDRFLIIDNQVYHFGASLKDLGKKWFAFSKFDKEAIKVLEKLS